MLTQDFESKTKELIDNLKGICANYGLGNDGNEFKIITQVFLYKFMNDKFSHEVKKSSPKVSASDNWEKELESFSEGEYKMLLAKLGGKNAKLKPEHFISYLHNKQNEPDFAKLFDDTLRDIAILNTNIFSVKSNTGHKIILFEEHLSQFISDPSQRDNFCRAIISQLVDFSFEEIFTQKFDFFSTIFEYLIKDYNKDGGGKYAEYYTPHTVSKIMASCLVDQEFSNVTCYDPSAGSGTLLMNIAHAIGEDRCTIFSQDISQKSSSLLRLNLILNNLVHSIPNIIQGNTMKDPYHKDGEQLKKFDFIVSNPPFKLDFSDWYEDAKAEKNRKRFFAGIPNIKPKSKDSMEIYLLFIQHIIHSLSDTGRAAIVVPTGFITAGSGVPKKIRQKLIESKMLRGVISMPSNIFATTGTNVSILFLDNANTKGDVVLMDASKLGVKVKDGKNQKTVLSPIEEKDIISTFNNHEAKEDFSVVVSYDDIKEKNYSFSAAQYFEIRIEYVDVTPEEFEKKMSGFQNILSELFSEGKDLEVSIQESLKGLKYE